MVEYNVCRRSVAETPENNAAAPSDLTMLIPSEIGPTLGTEEVVSARKAAGEELGKARAGRRRVTVVVEGVSP